MGVTGFLRDMFSPAAYGQVPVVETRGDTIDDLISRLRPSNGTWRPASVREALGFPSIFRACSLIAGTTGSLSMQAYRRGVLMDPEDRPIVMVRPDPFRKPRAFYRDTAWNMATRGEAVWWVAKRDGDGNATALLTIDPGEVFVEDNANDPRFPDITWRNRTTKRPLPANMIGAESRDFRFLPFMQEPGSFRGVGPLQLCGAAVSVAVQSQEFAANFYGDGGYPSTVIKAASKLSPLPDANGYTEADLLRDAWIARPNNVPKIIDPGIESVDEHEPDVARVQMLAARDYSNGEAGRMYGIPGSLLDYATPGSSLTYQNLEGEFGKWIRAGLWPYFLEEIEQEMSDLLPRSTVGRFNIDALTRADIKTRFEVYQIGIDTGVMSVELAQEKEGILPGDIENAPVPFAPVTGIPEIRSVAEAVRCDGTRTLKGIMRPCGKLLAEAGPFVGTCPRCSKVHAAAA